MTLDDVTLSTPDDQPPATEAPEKTPGSFSLSELGLDESSVGGLVPFEAVRERQELDARGPLEEFAVGTGRGVNQFQATAYATLGLLGKAVGADSIAEFGMEGYTDHMEEAAKYKAAVTDPFSQIDSWTDGTKYVFGLLGEQLPNLVASFGGGGIGAFTAQKGAQFLIGRAIRQGTERLVAGGMAKEAAIVASEKLVQRQFLKALGKNGVEKAMKWTTIGGSQAGMLPANVAGEVGSIGGEIYGKTGRIEPGTAFAYGLPAAALETGAEGLTALPALKAFMPGQEVSKLVSKKFLVDTGKSLATGMPVEGGTEYGQTWLEQLGLYEADPSENPYTPEKEKERQIAGAAGLVIGGVVSGGASTIGGIAEQARVSGAPLVSRALQTQGGSTTFAATPSTLNAAGIPTAEALDEEIDPPTTTEEAPASEPTTATPDFTTFTDEQINEYLATPITSLSDPTKIREFYGFKKLAEAEKAKRVSALGTGSSVAAPPTVPEPTGTSDLATGAGDLSTTNEQTTNLPQEQGVGQTPVAAVPATTSPAQTEEKPAESAVGSPETPSSRARENDVFREQDVAYATGLVEELQSVGALPDTATYAWEDPNFVAQNPGLLAKMEELGRNFGLDVREPAAVVEPAVEPEAETPVVEPVAETPVAAIASINGENEEYAAWVNKKISEGALIYAGTPDERPLTHDDVEKVSQLASGYLPNTAENALKYGGMGGIRGQISNLLRADADLAAYPEEAARITAGFSNGKDLRVETAAAATTEPVTEPAAATTSETEDTKKSAFDDVTIQLKDGTKINGLWSKELGFMTEEGDDIAPTDVERWSFGKDDPLNRPTGAEIASGAQQGVPVDQAPPAAANDKFSPENLLAELSNGGSVAVTEEEEDSLDLDPAIFNFVAAPEGGGTITLVPQLAEEEDVDAEGKQLRSARALEREAKKAAKKENPDITDEELDDVATKNSEDLLPRQLRGGWAEKRMGENGEFPNPAEDEEAKSDLAAIRIQRAVNRVMPDILRAAENNEGLAKEWAGNIVAAAMLQYLYELRKGSGNVSTSTLVSTVLTDLARGISSRRNAFGKEAVNHTGTEGDNADNVADTPEDTTTFGQTGTNESDTKLIDALNKLRDSLSKPLQGRIDKITAEFEENKGLTNEQLQDGHDILTDILAERGESTTPASPASTPNEAPRKQAGPRDSQLSIAEPEAPAPRSKAGSVRTPGTGAAVTATDAPTDSGAANKAGGRVGQQKPDPASVGSRPADAGAVGGSGNQQLSGQAGTRPGTIVVGEALLPEAGARAGVDTYERAGGFRLGVDQVQDTNLALATFLDNGIEGFMLANGTGQGKTAVQIAVADLYAKETGKKVLIVSLNEGSLNRFKEDAAAMGVDLSRFDFMTYTGLASGKGSSSVYGLAIYDEAHALKNDSSQRSIAASRVNTEHTLFATATPMDKPTGAVYFLSKLFKNVTETQLLERIGVIFRDMTDAKGRPVLDSNGQPVRQGVLKEGHSWETVTQELLKIRDEAFRIGSMVRRYMPFFGETSVANDTMSEEQRGEEQEIIEHFEGLMADASWAARRNLAGQLTQNLGRWTETTKADWAYRRIKEELAAGRNPILIAETAGAQNLAGVFGGPRMGLLGAVAARLRADGIDFAEIYGDNKVKKVKEGIRFQQGKVRVVLGTAASAATGIDLDDTTGAAPRTLLVASVNFSGDVFDQIMGRVSRRNTASPALVEFLTYRDNRSDQRRAETMEQKLSVLRAIQGGTDADVAMLKSSVDQQEKGDDKEKKGRRRLRSVTARAVRGDEKIGVGLDAFNKLVGVGGTAMDAVKNIARNTKFGQYKAISAWLQTIPMLNEIPVLSYIAAADQTDGFYMAGKVNINLPNFGTLGQREQEELLLHEILHSITAETLRADETTLTKKQLRAKMDLENLFEHIKSELKKENGGELLIPEVQIDENGNEIVAAGDPENYPLTNLDELITAMFTSPYFQNRLKEMTLPSSFKGKISASLKSVWDAALHFLTNIIGARTIDRSSVLFAGFKATMDLASNPHRYSGSVELDPLFQRTGKRQLSWLQADVKGQLAYFEKWAEDNGIEGGARGLTVAQVNALAPEWRRLNPFRNDESTKLRSISPTTQATTVTPEQQAEVANLFRALSPIPVSIDTEDKGFAYLPIDEGVNPPIYLNPKKAAADLALLDNDEKKAFIAGVITHEMLHLELLKTLADRFEGLTGRKPMNAELEDAFIEDAANGYSRLSQTEEGRALLQEARDTYPGTLEDWQVYSELHRMLGERILKGETTEALFDRIVNSGDASLVAWVRRFIDSLKRWFTKAPSLRQTVEMVEGYLEGAMAATSAEENFTSARLATQYTIGRTDRRMSLPVDREAKGLALWRVNTPLDQSGDPTPTPQKRDNTNGGNVQGNILNARTPAVRPVYKPDARFGVVSRLFSSEGKFNLPTFTQLQRLDARKREAVEHAKGKAKALDVAIREDFKDRAIPTVALNTALGTTENHLTPEQFDEFTKFKRIDPDMANEWRELTLAENRAAFRVQQASALASLPATTREAVTGMRNAIDKLSDLGINTGAFSDSMSEIVKANKGIYLHRGYAIMSDPKWLESLNAQSTPEAKQAVADMHQYVTNLAVAMMAKRIRAAAKEAGLPAISRAQSIAMAQADSETAEMSRNLMDSYKAVGDEGYNAIVRGRLPGQMSMSVTKVRGQIPEVVRNFWGEYRDPVSNFANTYVSVASYVANHEFLSRVKEIGLKEGWLHNDPLTAHPVGWVKVVPSGQGNMGPLVGVYAPKELAEAFAEYGDRTEHNWFVRTLASLTGMASLSKTALSVQSGTRNFLGNVIASVANGNFHRVVVRPHVFNKAFAVAFGKKSKHQALKEMAILLGLKGQGVEAGVTRSLIEQGLGKNDEGNAFMRMTKGLFDKMTGVYGGMDDFWKVVNFFGELSKFQDLTNEEILSEGARHNIDLRGVAPDMLHKTFAAEIVRQTTPTYDLAWSINQRIFKKIPFFGPFLTFTLETMRTIPNVFNYSLIQLRSPIASVRGAGAARLFGLSLAMVGPGAAAAFAGGMLGMDAEDDDALREHLPPWLKNAVILPISKKDGKVSYLDISFFDMYSQVYKEPIVAAMRAISRGEAIGEPAGVLDVTTAYLTQMLEPFVNEQIFSSSVIDVLRNSDKDGRPVYNPYDPARWAIAGLHIANSFKPGTVDSAERIYKAYTGFSEKSSGRTYDPVMETLAPFVGFRPATVDLANSLGYATYQYSQEKRKASELINKVLRSRGTVSPEEIASAYRQANEARDAIDDTMRLKFLTAVKEGVPERKAREILAAGGVPKKDIDMLTKGSAKDLQISKQTRKKLSPEMALKLRDAEKIISGGEGG